MRRSAHSFALTTVLACVLPAVASADVHIEGTPAAVRISTSQDSIADVLAALSGVFKIRYRSAIILDAPAAATYVGSFSQVVARLLDGYTYIVKSDGETAEVVIFGKRGEAAVPAASFRPAAPKDITSRWR